MKERGNPNKVEKYVEKYVAQIRAVGLRAIHERMDAGWTDARIAGWALREGFMPISTTPDEIAVAVIKRLRDSRNPRLPSFHSFLANLTITEARYILTPEGYRRWQLGLKLRESDIARLPRQSMALAAYPNPSLYEDFHGNPPKGWRKVRVHQLPKRLIKIGRLTRLEYEPEHPSKRAGTRFSHDMGDTGSVVLPHKPILATGMDGKGLFIVEDQSKFTERGIIG